MNGMPGTGSRTSNDPDYKSSRESGEDSEDECEILEESPCGRWLKRREEVEQRDVPGIDCAYLAMDTEEGVEVVWNEVQFSERKNFKAQEEKIQQVFENLTQLEHPNIVKFHRYWTDTHNDKPRADFEKERLAIIVTNTCRMQRTRLASLLHTIGYVKGRQHNYSRCRFCWSDIYYRIYVVGVVETVPKTHKKKCEKSYHYQHGRGGARKSCLLSESTVETENFSCDCKFTKKKKKKCTDQILMNRVSINELFSIYDIPEPGHYLHSCSPPIIHGNLTCDTIFIQHNGLVKIGSVAPDAIHHHVKTCRESMKNMHFIAPEYGVQDSPAMDIYSFGMCALEMAALEIQGNGDSGTLVTEDHINRTIDSLDDPRQKDFIHKCLNKDPTHRPSARELLFHPLLFEVHSLKLLSAHALVNGTANISETITDEVINGLFGQQTVVAEIVHSDGRPPHQTRMCDVLVTEKLDKFIEDVKNGIYPLTAFSAQTPPPPRPRAISPEMAESVKSVTPEPFDVENRRVVNMMCNVKPKEQSCELWMTILLRMDDKMNRQLTCLVSESDASMLLAQELVHFGFINDLDREKLSTLIEDTLKSYFHQKLGPSLLLPDTSTNYTCINSS